MVKAVLVVVRVAAAQSYVPVEVTEVGPVVAAVVAALAVVGVALAAPEARLQLVGLHQ